MKPSPKDFFLHLLSIITLYASAISFLVLIFQCINIWFPDAVNGFYYGGIYEPMRWGIAMLIIFFPAYVGTSAFLRKEYVKNPEKKELRVRKWLLYFTLFVTALIVLGDLVALLLNFLRGEITIRFILKVIGVFFVAFSVFGYYSWELKGKQLSKKVKAFIYAVSIIVLSAIVCGFVLAGSPSKERARKFDDQRISDLQSIQWEIISYWQSKESIPETLSELENPIRGFLVPIDPESKSPYKYKKTGDTSFELCATFNLENNATINEPIALKYNSVDSVWNHSVGEVCFERTIDKDIYPPFAEVKR